MKKKYSFNRSFFLTNDNRAVFYFFSSGGKRCPELYGHRHARVCGRSNRENGVDPERLQEIYLR